MSKFGLMDSEPENDGTQQAPAVPSLSDRLARFGAVAPRPQVDLAAADAAAATHGFVSREAPVPAPPYGGQPGYGLPLRMRRRRNVPVEPTRHLAIRLSASQYDRFVAYADLHRLTYHEALVQLMDESEAQSSR